MYEIQDEVLTKTKFLGFLLVVDIMQGAFILTLVNFLYEQTIPALKLFVMIIFLPLCILWVLPSPGNKGKRNYHRLIFILTRNKKTYQPFALWEEDEISQRKQEEDFFYFEEQEEGEE